MTQKKLNVWHDGQKLGIGVFLFLSVILKLVDEDMIPENWQMFATLFACIIAWQVVVVAYQRGCQHGMQGEKDAQ